MIPQDIFKASKDKPWESSKLDLDIHQNTLWYSTGFRSRPKEVCSDPISEEVAILIMEKSMREYLTLNGFRVVYHSYGGVDALHYGPKSELYDVYSCRNTHLESLYRCCEDFYKRSPKDNPDGF